MASKKGMEAARGSLGELQGMLQQFLGLSTNLTNPAAAALMQFLQGEGIFANPLFGMTGAERLLEEIKNFRGTIPGMMNDFQVPDELRGLMETNRVTGERMQDIINNRGISAESSFLRDRLTDILTANTPESESIRNAANALLANGGRTADMQSVVDAVRPLLADQGFTPSLRQAESTATDIIRNQGRTPETAELLRTLQSVVAGEGRDAQTGQLAATGQQLIRSGGMTPELTRLFSQVEQVLGQRGMTPEARQLFGEVMKIVGAGGQGGALLPMENVTSFARDAAATAVAQRSEAARRESNQRLGAAVAAGPADSFMAEFADEAAKIEAAAVRDAALGQQELQLKQLLGALGAGTDLSKSANALMTSFADLGGDIARTAAGNISTGASLMSDAEKIAAQRFGISVSGANQTLATEADRLKTGGSLLDNAMKNALARLNLGTSTTLGVEDLARQASTAGMTQLNQLLASQLGAGQTLQSLFATESGLSMDAARLLSQLTGQNADMFLGARGQFLDQQKAALQAALQSFGMQGDLMNTVTNQFLSSAQNLGQMGSIYAAIIPSIVSGFSNVSGDLVQAAMQPGFWSNFLGQMAGGLGQGLGAGITGGLGDIFNRGNNNSNSRGGGR